MVDYMFNIHVPCACPQGERHPRLSWFTSAAARAAATCGASYARRKEGRPRRWRRSRPINGNTYATEAGPAPSGTTTTSGMTSSNSTCPPNVASYHTAHGSTTFLAERCRPPTKGPEPAGRIPPASPRRWRHQRPAQDQDRRWAVHYVIRYAHNFWPYVSF